MQSRRWSAIETATNVVVKLCQCLDDLLLGDTVAVRHQDRFTAIDWAGRHVQRGKLGTAVCSSAGV